MRVALEDRRPRGLVRHRTFDVRDGGRTDVLTGQQARDYLGIGYHGLTTLVRRGLLRTKQLTDFAPWMLSRSELDSEPVQVFVKVLKATGRPPIEGESPESQQLLFPEKSGTPRKDVL